MTPEQEALYRRITAALEQRGAVVKLLLVCPASACRNGRVTVPAKVLEGERSWNCSRCQGTGTVVPSKAECFWRLTLAADRPVDLYPIGHGRWVVSLPPQGMVRRIHEGEGANPLDALMHAVAQSLGLEEAAK